MSLNFQEVREQVKRLGETAQVREAHLKDVREQARQYLTDLASDLERLRQKVQFTAHNYEASLRCALPVVDLSEPLDAHLPLPDLPIQSILLAADGSQIAPDRHALLNYSLINVGAIQMQTGQAVPPVTTAHCQLFYEGEGFPAGSRMTEERLALLRDLSERTLLADLAEQVSSPVITFTDGPMELWGSKDSGDPAEFQEKLDAYKEALLRLFQLEAVTAGYVDKPSANLVVRLLEVAITPDGQLPQVRDLHPLWGVTDFDLYARLLEPGERSAVFEMQSQSARNYPGPLGLHFFYLNVGRPGHPWLSRVEIPAWVAKNEDMLNRLQAALVYQCRIMGNRPYPYLLHRAHEAAVVSLDEKAQVTHMIAQELLQRGLDLTETSNKQYAKELGGRTSFPGLHNAPR